MKREKFLEVYWGTKISRSDILIHIY